MARFFTVTISIFLLFTLGCDDSSQPASDPTEGEIDPEATAEAEATAEPEPVDEDTFALKLADGYTDCFKQFDHNGSVDGRITAVVISDGSVADISYVGSAPDPVQSCILDMARARTIDGYSGEPGIAQFTYSGTYNSGIEMLSTTWYFRRYSALDSDGQAILEPYVGDASDGANNSEDSNEDGEAAAAAE